MILRELAAKLGLEVDAQSFAKGAAAVELAKAGLSKLVDVAGEMVTRFIETVEGVAEAGDQIKELSQATGVGEEALQRLANATKTEGVGIDGLAHSLTILTRMMAAAKGGSKDVAAAFTKLGVKVDDGRGHIRNADEVFLDLADAMSKIPDSAEKTALAFKVLGKSGPDMIKVLNLGREEMEELGRSGLVLTKEQIEAGDELVKTQRKLGAVTSGIWKTAIAPLLPEITELVKAYTAWRKANAEVMKARIKQFVGGLITVVRAVGSAFATAAKVIGGAIDLIRSQWKASLIMMTAALAPFIVQLVAAGIAAIGTALGMAAAWAIAAAPFIAIGAAIAGVLLLLDDLEGYKQGKDSLFGRWKKVTDEWLQPSDKDPWWLAAIKALVIWMEKALGVADDLGLVQKKTTAQYGTGDNAPGSVSVKRKSGFAKLFGHDPIITRDAYGNPNVELGWGDKLFGSEVVMGPPLASGTSWRGENGTVIQRIGDTNITITPLPGQNEAELGRVVRQHVDEALAEDREAAAAALPATQ